MTEVVDRPARTTTHAAAAGTAGPLPAVDVAALGELLLGKWADVRRQALDLAAREELHKTEGVY